MKKLDLKLLMPNAHAYQVEPGKTYLIVLRANVSREGVTALGRKLESLGVKSLVIAASRGDEVSMFEVDAQTDLVAVETKAPVSDAPADPLAGSVLESIRAHVEAQLRKWVDAEVSIQMSEPNAGSVAELHVDVCGKPAKPARMCVTSSQIDGWMTQRSVEVVWFDDVVFNILANTDLLFPSGLKEARQALVADHYQPHHRCKLLDAKLGYICPMRKGHRGACYGVTGEQAEDALAHWNNPPKNPRTETVCRICDSERVGSNGYCNVCDPNKE